MFLNRPYPFRLLRARWLSNILRGEDELDVMSFEEIIEPVPAGRPPDDGFVGTLERCEVGQNALRMIA